MTATTPSVANIKLGACDVMYGTDDLGYTKGGVTVSLGMTTHEVKVDQFGDAAVDDYIQGRSVQVKVPMAESDLDKLALVFPGATLTTSTDQSKKKLEVPHSSGVSLRSLAKTLILHPTANDAADKNDDFVVNLAVPNGNIEFSYTFDNERIYTVTFIGYPDTGTGLLYTFGDPAATSA